MQTLIRVLFESPWPIYVGLALAELVGLYLWRSGRTAKEAIRLLYPLAATVLVFAVATLVVTKREKLVSTVQQLERDAAGLDVDAVVEHLDEDFRLISRGSIVGRERAVDAFRSAIEACGVTAVRFLRVTVQTDGEDGRTEVVTQIEAQRGLAEAGPMIVWNLHWRYGPAGWRIIRVEQGELGYYVRL